MKNYHGNCQGNLPVTVARTIARGDGVRHLDGQVVLFGERTANLAEYYGFSWSRYRRRSKTGDLLAKARKAGGATEVLAYGHDVWTMALAGKTVAEVLKRMGPLMALPARCRACVNGEYVLRSYRLQTGDQLIMTRRIFKQKAG